MRAPTFVERQHLCRNCLCATQGAFCAHCGQKHDAGHRPIGQIISELGNDMLNFDNKLLGTLKCLLCRPGMLSTEYFAHRRARYVSPLKLYFFLSLISFFLIQHTLTQLTEPMDMLPLRQADALSSPEQQTHNPSNDKVAINWLPNAANALINERMARLKQVTASKDGAKQGLNALLATSPQALLLMLPFFAALLKLTYCFQNRLYIEHLVVALHNHSFLLLTISLLIITDQLLGGWGTAQRWSQTWRDIFSIPLICWLPLYFLLSLKRVYRQGWGKTLLKYAFLSFAYLFLLIFGFLLNFMLGLLFL
jgi:hypothetical protein